MNTELQQEAKKHAGIPLEKNIDSEERYFNSNCVRFDDFIAGATSRYVEKQKLEFAIEQLKKASMLIVSQHERKANLRIIIELEQKLKEYETT